jgi:hypothetical protein
MTSREQPHGGIDTTVEVSTANLNLVAGAAVTLAELAP